MSATAAALFPTPLSDERSVLLSQLVHGLDSKGLWWLSGYTAGLAQAHAAPQLALLPGGVPVAAVQARQTLTVLYGSQTGNARREAEKIASAVEAAGHEVKLLRLDSYPVRELANEKFLYLVISTQGEGDPPDDSIGFVEFLLGRRAPRLPELRFSVLGLGDSSYARFCGTAKQIDARLAELGARRLFDSGFTDVDIETVAGPWRSKALGEIDEWFKSTAPAPAHGPLATVTALHPNPDWSPDRPFHAELFTNQRITGREYKASGFRVHGPTDKDVRHVELSLGGSGLRYEPGDALGIHHRNPQALVDWALQATGLDADAEVTLGDTTLPLREWLGSQRELTRLSRPFLATVAEHSENAELSRILGPDNPEFSALLGDHQIIDVLRRWPAAWTPETLVSALRPQTRRLYSIASSQKRVGEEVHLTLDVVSFEAHGHAHLGAASGFLAALQEGDTLPVYIEPNERFRLPADTSRDVIMIGPGTGVAPFRAFVQERAEIGASGRNWLFFGARHFNTGFLYQTEWQEALAKGELYRLDLAFSRDQAERIHVQQRLREQGRTLYDWLQNGAHLYVCGAIGMSRDVHAAVRDVIAAHNGGDAERAAEYLSALQREGRYARDVY